MRIDRIIKKKLKSRAGETIGEVLVALLISSLALVMLASMIASTTSMVTKSKAKMKEYYDAGKELEQQVATDETETLVITVSDGTLISIEEAEIPYFKNETFGKTVYAYGKP